MELVGQDLAALCALIAMELGLGIDNVVVLEALISVQPALSQARLWRVGVVLAVLSRVLLLWLMAELIWIQSFTVTVGEFTWPVSNVVLAVGGIFLLVKGVIELTRPNDGAVTAVIHAKEWWVLIEVVLFDVLLSFDSVFTAIGLTHQLWVMTVSIVSAGGIVLFLRPLLSDILLKHPMLKRIVWALLMIIGVSLFCESMQVIIPRWILSGVVGSVIGLESMVGALRRSSDKVSKESES